MPYATIIWSWIVCFDSFGTSSDGFWIVSTTPFVHVHDCYNLPHGYFWFEKVSCLWINSNMGMCFQLVYNGFGPQTPTWQLSHLSFKGDIFYVCFCCCWSLCANDSHLI